MNNEAMNNDQIMVFSPRRLSLLVLYFQELVEHLNLAL